MSYYKHKTTSDSPFKGEGFKEGIFTLKDGNASLYE